MPIDKETDIPLEVSEALGIEKYKDDPMTYRIAIEGTKEMLKEYGKDWILKNAEYLRKDLEMVASL